MPHFFFREGKYGGRNIGMKILVVDDFRVDREELVELIESFGDLAIDGVEACEDGVTALELVESEAPDIILCDVEMPYMDGFALLRAIREEYPDIKFVFCSLYNRTEYLKNALDLDSNGYLLKPVDPQELHDCLRRMMKSSLSLISVREELTRLREQAAADREANRQLFVLSLLYGYLERGEIIHREDELELDEWRGGIYLAVAEIDDYSGSIENLPEEERRLFPLAVWRALSEALEELCPKGPAFFVPVASGRICYGVLRGQVEGEQAFWNLGRRCVQRCRQAGVSVTVAVGPGVTCPDTMAAAFQQCQYMLRFKYSIGKGRVLLPNDIPGAPGMDQSPMPLKIQEDLRYALNSGSTPEIDRFLDEYYEIMRGMSVERQKNTCYSILVCLQLLLNQEGETLQSVLGVEDKIWEKLLRFETIQDVRVWMRNILVFSGDFITQKAERNAQNVISHVRQYIQENLSADLSLGSIAQHFFYSPNYLNTRFKKEMNMTISEYITSEKIRTAKGLLLSTGKGIAEISAQVGYEHVSYFNYVFKRLEGIAPREYRQKHGHAE